MTDRPVGVLLVEPRAGSGGALRQLFAGEWGWDVMAEVRDIDQAVVAARRALPDVVVIDTGLADPDWSELPALLEPLGRPVVIGLADFPHQLGGRVRSVLKGVPSEHLRRTILAALAEEHPEDPRWAAPVVDLREDDPAGAPGAGPAGPPELGVPVPPLDRGALPALESVTDAPEAVRIGAARAYLAHRDRDVRRTGLGLVRPEDDEGSTVLAPLLGDEDGEVAAAALALLETFPPAEAVATVWSALRGAAGRNADLLIDALLRIDPVTTRRLARQASAGLDPADRILGLRVGLRLGGADLADRIDRALSDPSRDLRLTAALALLDHPELVHLEAVGLRTRDPDVEVRRAAVRVLASAADERAVGPLLDAAGDPSPDVRDVAREVLLSRCHTAAVRLVVAALSDPARRRSAAGVLAEVPEGAVDLILHQLPEADTETGAAMARVLSAPGAISLMTAGLSDPDPDRRRRCLRGVGLVADGATVGPIGDCLEDPDPGIRRDACVILGTLRDRSAVPALRRVLATDPDMAVVAAADAALSRIGRVDVDITGREPDEPLPAAGPAADQPAADRAADQPAADRAADQPAADQPAAEPERP